MPVEGAYSAFAYTNGNYGSGTVYRGEDYRTFVLGFPLECVENTDVRTYLMQTIVQTLLSKKRRKGRLKKRNVILRIKIRVTIWKMIF